MSYGSYNGEYCRDQYEDDKAYQEEALKEEHDYYLSVTMPAEELAKQDGKKELIRISCPNIYKAVNQLVPYGAACLGDDKVNWSKGFHTPKGTWYVLLNSKTSK